MKFNGFSQIPQLEAPVEERKKKTIRAEAEAVAKVIPGSINRNTQSDKWSYGTNFDLFRSLVPHHKPQYNLDTTIQELRDGLDALTFGSRIPGTQIS